MSESAQITWSPLASSLAHDFVAANRWPRTIAISGAQGSGKTTLAALLTQRLIERGVAAVACSLDDFYYPRATRIKLARSVHPLLVTRGVPGTHDVGLCMQVLDDVVRRTTALPRFDKSLDDRIDAARWPI